MRKNFIPESTFLKVQWTVIAASFAFLVSGVVARVSHKDPDKEPVLIHGVDYHSMMRNARFVLGDESRRYCLVEFFDYECQPCRAMSPFVHKVIQGHREAASLATHNFPLPMHRHARDLALVACALLDQATYTQFDSKAIALTGEDLQTLLESWQTKLSKANPNWMASAKKRLDDENKIATQLQIDSTPTIFVIDQVKGTIYKCLS